MVVKDYTEPSLKQHIETCLKAVKVKPQLKGYDRLIVAIEKYCEYPEKYQGRKFYTLLFDDVAVICNTTNANVEKSIRKALEITWTKEYSKYQEILYGDIVSLDKGKPTSKDFIIRTANIIKHDFTKDL